MAKAQRWVIVGRHGLYVGQTLTRAAAIAEHVHCFRGKEGVPADISEFTNGRRLDPDQVKAWKWRKRCGDRVVRAIISF